MDNPFTPSFNPTEAETETQTQHHPSPNTEPPPPWKTNPNSTPTPYSPTHLQFPSSFPAPNAPTSTPTYLTSTPQNTLSKMHQEIDYAQNLLSQIQLTLHSINATLSTLDPGVSPFASHASSSEFSNYDNGVGGQGFGEHTMNGMNGGIGNEIDHSGESNDLFELTQFGNPGTAEEGEIEGTGTATATETMGSQEISPFSFAKNRKIAEPPLQQREKMDLSFTAYMADLSIPAIPEVSSILTLNNFVSTVSSKDFATDENGSGRGKLEGQDKQEDEELRREIEEELNRSLFGVDKGKDEEEVKARKTRCSDGSLRGQYEECP